MMKRKQERETFNKKNMKERPKKKKNQRSPVYTDIQKIKKKEIEIKFINA